MPDSGAHMARTERIRRRWLVLSERGGPSGEGRKGIVRHEATQISSTIAKELRHRGVPVRHFWHSRFSTLLHGPHR